jgi:hypothetical protein
MLIEHLLKPFSTASNTQLLYSDCSPSNVVYDGIVGAPTCKFLFTIEHWTRVHSHRVGGVGQCRQEGGGWGAHDECIVAWPLGENTIPKEEKTTTMILKQRKRY